jgi:hypothetical protein
MGDGVNRSSLPSGNSPGEVTMNRRRTLAHLRGTVMQIPRLTAATLSFTLAAAAFAATPTGESAERILLNLTPAERAELIAEATAAAVSPGTVRNATAGERAELAIPPGRRAAATPENQQKRAAVSANRELIRGNAVGRVVGTELMSHRSVKIAADGKHLESCGSGEHTHDAKTTVLIAGAAKEASVSKASQGANRE